MLIAIVLEKIVNSNLLIKILTKANNFIDFNSYKKIEEKKHLETGRKTKQPSNYTILCDNLYMIKEKNLDNLRKEKLMINRKLLISSNNKNIVSFRKRKSFSPTNKRKKLVSKTKKIIYVVNSSISDFDWI